MQVAKWGNSLAVRIPADLVRRLKLREGDDVQLEASHDGGLVLTPEVQRREAIIAQIRALARPLPPDYKFDREEANARDASPD